MIEKLKALKAKIEKLKQKCSSTIKLQVFKFQPFSLKQKKVLTWWCDTSPVKDKDGIIADGAIRSGKTVCMSLSFEPKVKGNKVIASVYIDTDSMDNYYNASGDEVAYMANQGLHGGLDVGNNTPHVWDDTIINTVDNGELLRLAAAYLKSEGFSVR